MLMLQSAEGTSPEDDIVDGDYEVVDEDDVKINHN